MERKKIKINIDGEIIEAEVDVLKAGVCEGAIPTFVEEQIGSISGKGLIIHKKSKKKGG